MFENNGILIAFKMEGSMKITPSKKSTIVFNGNQHMNDSIVTGLPK